MLALQYGFALAETFDMTALRRRVAERGPVFDRLPGLAWKAFLGADRSRSSLVPSVANQYAVFTVWHSPEALRDFLTGPLFDSVVDAFGRPAVRLMPVLSVEAGDTSRPPLVAVHETIPISRSQRPSEMAHRQAGLSAAGAVQPRPGQYGRTVAIDVDRWEIVRFALFHSVAAAKTEAGGALYEVLHLSVPQPVC